MVPVQKVKEFHNKLTDITKEVEENLSVFLDNYDIKVKEKLIDSLKRLTIIGEEIKKEFSNIEGFERFSNFFSMQKKEEINKLAHRFKYLECSDLRDYYHVFEEIGFDGANANFTEKDIKGVSPNKGSFNGTKVFICSDAEGKENSFKLNLVLDVSNSTLNTTTIEESLKQLDSSKRSLDSNFGDNLTEEIGNDSLLEATSTTISDIDINNLASESTFDESGNFSLLSESFSESKTKENVKEDNVYELLNEKKELENKDPFICNYYQLLSIEKGIILEKEIKENYQKRRGFWLSEMRKCVSENEQQNIKNISSLITEAFCVLSHPNLKKIYDEYLEQGKEDIFTKYIGSQFSSFLNEMWNLVEGSSNPYYGVILPNYDSELECNTEKHYNSLKIIQDKVFKVLLETLEELREEIFSEKIDSEGGEFKEKIKIKLIHSFKKESISVFKNLDSGLGVFFKDKEFCSEMCCGEIGVKELLSTFKSHTILVSFFSEFNWKIDEENIIGEKEFTQLRIFEKKTLENLEILSLFEKEVREAAKKKGILMRAEISVFDRLLSLFFSSSDEERCEIIRMYKKEILKGNIEEFCYGRWTSCHEFLKKVLFSGSEGILGRKKIDEDDDTNSLLFGFQKRKFLGVISIVIILFIIIIPIVLTQVRKTKKRRLLSLY